MLKKNVYFKYRGQVAVDGYPNASNVVITSYDGVGNAATGLMILLADICWVETNDTISVVKDRYSTSQILQEVLFAVTKYRAIHYDLSASTRVIPTMIYDKEDTNLRPSSSDQDKLKFTQSHFNSNVFDDTTNLVCSIDDHLDASSNPVAKFLIHCVYRFKGTLPVEYSAKVDQLLATEYDAHIDGAKLVFHSVAAYTYFKLKWT